MTDDELKQAAQAAELCSEQEWYGQKIMAAQWQEDVDLMPYLRRFAAAVQAAERERWQELADHLRHCRECGETDVRHCHEGAAMWNRVTGTDPGA